MIARLAAVALALSLAAPAAGAVLPSAAFVFDGHGWGHGIGLSQYGALGYAEHGATYAQILAHYYPGTTLGTVPARPIRVLLAETRRTVRVSSASDFTVVDGSGASHDLAAGDYAFGRGLTLKLDGATPTQLPGPLVFRPGASVLQLNGKPYRGFFTAIGGKTLQIVNTLGLEAYLDGVVPSEMPYVWNAEALKAQAVAARSYALATREPDAPYDVFGDDRSQVYGGLDAEHGATTAAVSATAGTVVLYRGQVATTYFYSTSGGRTAAIQDEWQGSKPVPYLVSVPDPYDSLSPYHDWGPVVLGGARIGTLLKAPGPVLDLATTPNASGRVGSADVTAARGDLTLTGSKLRLALGLRSTWFTVGELELAPPPDPVIFGASAALTATAKALAGQPALAQLADGVWQPVALAAGASPGSYGATVTPTRTTSFRLTLGPATVTLRLPVSSAVTLQQVPGGVGGTVAPAVAGTEVAIQRQDGSAWTTVATAAEAGDGSFTVPLALDAGASYRARVAAGGGLVAGSSPALLAASP